MCTYRTRFGAPCPLPAAPDSLVCAAHGHGKINLARLRKDAAQLGPLVLDRLEEFITTGDALEAMTASKLWVEISGVKDVPANGGGLDEEELEQARRSLGNKLEGMISHLAKRQKTA